jgi:transmembrane sensor
LNTDSKAQVGFSETERRIVLERGEAYFEVVRDARRPFIVAAGASEIRVTGTKFTVRRDADSTAVTVTEGSVLVAPIAGKPPVKLQLGDKAILSESQPRPVKIAKVDPERANAWLDGYLDFDDAPLASVIAEVNRYAAKPIMLEDQSLAAVHLSARFRVGDVEALKFALKDRLGVQAVDDGGRVLLRR